MACITPISIQISLSPAPVSAQGMGTLLVVSSEATFVPRVQYYTSLSDFVADTTAYGGDATGETFEAVSGAFSAKNIPSRVGVGRIDGVETIVATMAAIMAEDSDGWYGVMLANMGEANNVAFAAAASPLQPYKMVFVQDKTATMLNPADSTDLASQMMALGYENVVTCYHEGTAANGSRLAGTWAADRLSVDLETNATVWYYVACPGVVPSTLSSTEMPALDGKNCNYYTCVCGTEKSGTNKGVTASGSSIEEVMQKHWLSFELRATYCTALLDIVARNSKFPYNDNGMGVFENLTLGVLGRGVTAGWIAGDPAPFVTMPKVADLSPAVIDSHLLSFSFDARPTGSISSVALTGSVSIPLS